jgi:hypothetical protein
VARMAEGRIEIGEQPVEFTHVRPGESLLAGQGRSRMRRCT